MHLPLRLRAGLFRYRFLHAFSEPAAAPIFRFSALATHFLKREGLDDSPAGLEWHSPRECVRLAESVAAPVVWVGGTEPLLHPEIGEVARALVQSARHVFLHTSGVDLRRRIHEFRPDSRLFFTIEFSGDALVRGRSGGQPLGRVLESIRTAKLSGFLVCAHMTVGANTDVCGIDELFELLDEKDVDGFIASSGGAKPSVALAARLEEILGTIRHAGWERFSRLLESSYAQPMAAPAPPELPGSRARAFEEGV